jgi:hypothetical protein
MMITLVLSAAHARTEHAVANQAIVVMVSNGKKAYRWKQHAHPLQGRLTAETDAHLIVTLMQSVVSTHYSLEKLAP